ncbi:hypothetical protein NEMIN01_1154 [Nematocida minor]|uniref:uncharacterized protein n=1 Tax=Nematocida minor TaxID=1912983 RepID=UPI00221F0EF2|nr:uncharacterized protein NEMIN01_1154 [Nematocida minor]KAI5190689.1 hypothetical protein NEMIN01_1154 [Nematocida minor]
MILQRALLKQVLTVGAIALSYLQGASCVPENKSIILNNLCGYWHDNIYFIEKQVQSCSDFLNRARSIENEEKGHDNALKIGVDTLSKITEELASLNRIWKEIRISLGLLGEESVYTRIKKYISSNVVKCISKGKAKKNLTLESLSLKMLNTSTSVIEKIHTFNSHMLDFIADYCEKKYEGGSEIHDLVIFKLAKRNKMFAANIVFAFFELELSLSDDEIDKKELRHIVNCLDNSISKKSISDYAVAVMKDLQKKKVNMLVSADTHFKYKFHGYGLNLFASEDVIDMYLCLIEKDLSETEISRFKDILPKQIIRLVVIEYAMDGHLLNYKKNHLFSNLEKIIVSLEESEQNKILNGLSMLWEDWYCDSRKIDLSFEDFCKESYLKIDFFKSLQFSFMYSKWMYDLDMPIPEPENPSARNELAKEIHFDLSYLHPMWYMCKRYERISYLDSPDAESTDSPFMERTGNLILIRPYKISRKDDNLARERNMRDFMNTSFLSLSDKIEIVCRHQDAKHSCLISDQFFEFFEIRLQRRRGYISPNV